MGQDKIPDRPDCLSLTPREADIAAHLRMGLSPREIVEALRERPHFKNMKPRMWASFFLRIEEKLGTQPQQPLVVALNSLKIQP